MSMTPRERVLCALAHEKPDRLPTDLGTTNCTSVVRQTYEKLLSHFGLSADTQMMFSPFQIVQPDERLLQRLQVDTRGLPGDYDAYEGRQWVNEHEYLDRFGVLYRMPENGLYYDFYDYPLKDFEDVEEIEDHYTWPEAVIPAEVAGLRARAEALHRENRYAIVGDVVNSGIWERSQNLRGFDNLLADLIVNKGVAHYILRRMVDHQKARMAQYLGEVGEYLDVVFVGDDLATGQSTVMSKELFREMLKPYFAEYWQFLKERAPHARLMYHSCGAVEPFLDDLIEIGMDILNPIQVNAVGMDPAALKKRYGKRLCFWGAVDAHGVMPHGSPEDVRREVELRAAQLGPEGYVMCENHNVQADVPAENVAALYARAKEINLG